MPRSHPDRPGSRRTAPLPKNWRQLRARVLRRDGQVCQIRYTDICQGKASEVDHMRGAAIHDLDALQAACTPCHARKTGRDAGRRSAEVRPRRKREPEAHPGLIR